MRLELQAPPSWTAAAGEYRAAGARVVVGPIIAVPADLERSIDELLAHQAPPCASASRAELALESSHGWPMRLIEVVRCDPQGAPIETRWAVLFTLLDRGAAVLVRWPGPAASADEIFAVIAAARPEWSGGAASLAELFEGAEAARTAPSQPLAFWIN